MSSTVCILLITFQRKWLPTAIVSFYALSYWLNRQFQDLLKRKLHNYNTFVCVADCCISPSRCHRSLRTLVFIVRVICLAYKCNPLSVLNMSNLTHRQCWLINYKLVSSMCYSLIVLDNTCVFTRHGLSCLCPCALKLTNKSYTPERVGLH